MLIPILCDVPLVQSYARNFKSLFDRPEGYQHFRTYLNGLIIVPKKNLAQFSAHHIFRPDASNLDRFMNSDHWQVEALQEKRLSFMKRQTKPLLKNKPGLLAIDDTLASHVGSLFDYIDTHYDHGNGHYANAHNPVTSLYVNGPVRYPVGLKLYRRYEEATDWEAFVQKHFPDQTIPKRKKPRQKFHQKVDPVLLEDPEFKALHEAFQTKIQLACDLLAGALEAGLDFSCVLFDGWYLAPVLVDFLKTHEKDWISILKTNRRLVSSSIKLQDENGERIRFDQDSVRIDELVPLIPCHRFKKITTGGKDYWVFTRNVILPSLGPVRIVISFDNQALSGSYAVLVTNRLDWGPIYIIKTYLKRWPIETFYQDVKQLLGFDTYQLRSMDAILKHWQLVFLAYGLLSLKRLQKTASKKAQVPLQTIGQVCRQQAQANASAFLDWVFKKLEAGISINIIRDTLFPKQTKMIAA